MKIENILLSEIVPYKNNPRKNDKAVNVVAKSIKEFGFNVPILLDKANRIIAGHTRLRAANQLGLTEVPVIWLENLSEEQANAFRIMDNKAQESSYWDDSLLVEEFKSLKKSGFDLNLTGFNEGERTQLFFDNENDLTQTLKDRYIMPPFSVLDTRQGYWQKRKKSWFKLIGQQVNTREGKLGIGLLESINNGVSIFDPLLAEIMYNWFCPKGGTIFNPFSGGIEQPVVAGIKGYKYKGIELRKEQVEVNKQIINTLKLKNIQLFCDDALNLDKYIEPNSADFVITCPPYYDLENYSKLKEDMSNMSEEKFDKTYKEIINKTANTLKKDMFACIVVGEVRNKEGLYRGLIPKTIQYAQEAGLKYYNELVLINMIGTLPLRIRKSWDKSKKIGKCHQNILIFKK